MKFSAKTKKFFSCFNKPAASESPAVNKPDKMPEVSESPVVNKPDEMTAVSESPVEVPEVSDSPGVKKPEEMLESTESRVEMPEVSESRVKEQEVSEDVNKPEEMSEVSESRLEVPEILRILSSYVGGTDLSDSEETDISESHVVNMPEKIPAVLESHVENMPDVKKPNEMREASESHQYFTSLKKKLGLRKKTKRLAVSESNVEKQKHEKMPTISESPNVKKLDEMFKDVRVEQKIKCKLGVLGDADNRVVENHHHRSKSSSICPNGY